MDHFRPYSPIAVCLSNISSSRPTSNVAGSNRCQVTAAPRVGLLATVEEGESQFVHIGFGSGDEALAQRCAEGEYALTELDESTVFEVFEQVVFLTEAGEVAAAAVLALGPVLGVVHIALPRRSSAAGRPA